MGRRNDATMIVDPLDDPRCPAPPIERYVIAAFIAIAVLIAAGVFVGAAQADPKTHKVLVMRAESSADWATRSTIEQQVMGLARNVDRGVGMSDTTFTEMAEMIGCTGTIDACKGKVIEALGVDEIVIITIAPASGNSVTLSVRRATKTGGPAVSGVVDKDSPKVVALAGPLFGATKVIDAPAAAKPATPPPSADKGRVVIENERKTEPVKADAKPGAKIDGPKLVEPDPPPSKPVEAKHDAPKAEPAKPKPVRTAEVTAAPNNAITDDDRPRPGRKYVAGIAVGGGLVVVGLILWQRAGDAEREAKTLPARTVTDFDNLRAVERRGDRDALWGNIAVVTGVVVGGVSGYLWWRHAHAAPMVVDHGAGVALTLEVP